MNSRTVFRVLLAAAIVALVSFSIAPVAADETNTSAYAPDRIFVMFQEGANSAGILANSLSSLSASSEPVEVLMDFNDLVPGLQVIQLPAGVTVEQAIAFYSSCQGVVYAEPDYYVSIDSIPTDPEYPKLWGLNNLSAQGGASAEPAWDITTGDGSIVVAVLDTGVDITHPDLQAHIWNNTQELNGVSDYDDDGNGYVDDVHGWSFIVNSSDVTDYNSHGTHCAGTIGAVANNGIGVAGTAWNVTIMPVAVLPAAGSSRMDIIIAGINYAVKNDVDIISMSLGGGGEYEQTLHNAINATEEKGIVVVAAAGNNGVDTEKTPHWPSSLPNDNIISVAASNQTNGRADFSSYGNKSVDLAAPGVGIYSTVPLIAMTPGEVNPANSSKFSQLGEGWLYMVHNGTDFCMIGGSNSSVLCYNEPIVPKGDQFGLKWALSYYNLTAGQTLKYLVSRTNFSEYTSVADMLNHSSDWIEFGTNSKIDNIGYQEEWSMLWRNVYKKIPSNEYYVGIYYNSTNATSRVYLYTTTIANNYTLSDHSYGFMQGTSMATPMVSGAVALIKSVNPDLTPSEIRQLLINTVDKFDAWNGIVVSGGRLNITAAVMAACPVEIAENGAKYKSVADAFNAVDATNKTVRLIYNSTLTDEIPVNMEVILNLNGSSLTAAPNHRLFFINEDGNLTVTSSDNEGYLIGNGTVPVSDKEGNGGGIYLCKDGNLTMSGNVNLIDCDAANCGGGVYIENNSTFTMFGNVNISDCKAVGYGGGVYIENNGVFAMEGGNIDGNTAYWGAGVSDAGTFSINGSAVISANNDVMLFCDALSSDDNYYYHNVTVLTSFTGQIGAITLSDSDLVEKPLAWVNQVIAKDGKDALGRIYLNASDLYKGYRLSEQNNDIVLNISTTNVTATGGVATFGNDNYTVVDATQSTVSKILLKDVSHVKEENVEFTACNASIEETPSVSGYSIETISVFEINATVNGTSRFNLTIGFQDSNIADKNKNNVWFFHYNTTNMKWDDKKLTSSIVETSGANITYQVETSSFSPFCTVISTQNPQPSPSYSGSSRQSGSTVILSEGQVAPTVTPTITSTITPTQATPAVPTVKPTTQSTTQSTQSSPAPVFGIIAGLGASALVLIRMRR